MTCPNKESSNSISAKPCAFDVLGRKRVPVGPLIAMAGPVAAGLEPVLSKILSDGQATSPPLETLAATVLNECSTLAEANSARIIL